MKKLLLIISIFLLTAGIVSAEAVINASPKGVSTSATTTPELVGWWTFDGRDMVNGKINDRSESNNDGNLISISTSTFYTIGKLGQAGKFDGVNDYALIPDSASLQPANFTISSWFNCQNFTNPQTIISKNYTTAPWSSPFASIILRVNSATQIEFGRNPGSYQTENATVSLLTNQWYHLSATYLQSEERTIIYLNGVEVLNSFSGADAPIIYSSQPLTIGADHSSSPSGDNANCKIDDVRIYNRDFSATDISHLYKNGTYKTNTSTTTPIGTLRGYWSFDGKTMLTGAAKDLTSNNNTGTFSGIATSTAYTKGKIGQALQFDGVNDAMTIPMSISGLSRITVAFWMKWDAYANNDDLAMEYTNNFNSKNGFIIDPNQGTGKFRVGISSAAATANLSDLPARPSAGVWHHYVIVLDRTIVGANIGQTVYLDGVLQTMVAATQTYVAATNFDSGSLYLMSRGAASLFGQGAIDELRIYSGALTATEALRLYKLGAYRIRGTLP